MDEKTRCAWVGIDPLMIAYHDEEWGVPVHDDRKLFEFMVLDAFQAGLSWRTVLRKRENFRQAFAGFAPDQVARFTARRVEKLLTDPGIIRNRAKVAATVKNAQLFLAVQDEFGSFDSYVWRFVSNRTVHSRWKSAADIPAKTEASDDLSRDLRLRGFSFVGSTICYAFMQAAGMVNDHLTDCFRYRLLARGGSLDH